MTGFACDLGQAGRPRRVCAHCLATGTQQLALRGLRAGLVLSAEVCAVEGGEGDVGAVVWLAKLGRMAAGRG